MYLLAISALPRLAVQQLRHGELEVQCKDPAVYSPVLTGMRTSEGVNADALRKLICPLAPAWVR